MLHKLIIFYKKFGLIQERKKAVKKFQKKIEEFETRDKQQNIYGVKTLKQQVSKLVN